MHKLRFRAMGSEMLAVLDAEEPGAAGKIAEVPLWFEYWEQRLSRFRADSDLSKLNRSPGQAVTVDPILREAVRVALEAARVTDGLVTPTMLAQIEAAGYTQSFDLMRERAVKAPTTAEPGPAPDWRGVDVDEATGTIRLPQNLGLDLGGTAKGWAADRAVEMLAQRAPALLDAGGDVAVSGPRADGQGWPIGVEDPMDAERQITMIDLRAGGVATSGRDYRRWQHNGVWKHHIIDPRTGQPAETDIMSATIIGPSAAKAEAAAKAALILGSRAGLEWIEARPEYAALLVLEDGQVVRSSRMVEHEWSQVG